MKITAIPKNILTLQVQLDSPISEDDYWLLMDDLNTISEDWDSNRRQEFYFYEVPECDEFSFTEEVTAAFKKYTYF